MLALLNSGLFQLKASGEYDELYKKWFAVYEQRQMWQRYRPYIIGILTFVGILALFIILAAEEIRAEMAKAEQAGKSLFTFQHRLASGKIRHVEVYTGTVKFGEKNLLYSIVHDVTDRKLAEASNKELEAFAYSISHDLRAPLRAIGGFSRILLEDYSGKPDEEGKRVCGVISENARKMSQLINDLLAFSRLTRAEMQDLDIDMNRMVDSVYHELAGEGRKQVNLVVDALPQVKGDPDMIRQVWSNLIENALKFTTGRETPEIHIRGTREKKRVIFSVEDNGVGFDMQYSDKLFRVFQRLHPPKEFQGSGVGLAIVQRVVERHGGRTWAKGEPGQGAIFYFSLPEK